MANNYAPNGFVYTRNYQNSAPTYQNTIQQIAYNNANTFGKGDVVKLLNTGYIDRALTSDTEFLGVIDWVEYYDTVQQKKIRGNGWFAPSTALAGSVIASVNSDPFAVYAVQVGPSGSGPVVQANIGNNINFASNAAPNTIGISTAYANFSTIATTATLPWRIINIGINNIFGYIGGGDNTLANNIIEVIPNPGAFNLTNGTGV